MSSIKIERAAQNAACPQCNGFADRVDTTDEEDNAIGCGRPGCCAYAFKCRLCDFRFVVSVPAPEME